MVIFLTLGLRGSIYTLWITLLKLGWQLPLSGMATPAKWDVNSPNPGLELPKLGIRTPTTQDDNSPTRPVENPKIPCIYWAESVFKKSAPIIYS